MIERVMMLNTHVPPEFLESLPNNIFLFGTFRPSGNEPIGDGDELALDFREKGLTGSAIAKIMREEGWLLVLEGRVLVIPCH